MGIFTRIFGQPAPVRSFAASRSAALPDSKLPDSMPGDNSRRELVHVALSDVRRRHGIPTAWLDCEVLVISGREPGREPGRDSGYGSESRLLVQLLILQWDERLLKYSLAIQRQLTVQLLRLDPVSSRWLQGVVWRYAPGASSPFMSMPDQKVWAVHPSEPRAKHDVLDRRVFSRTGSLFPKHLDRRRELHKEPKNDLEVGGQGSGQKGEQKSEQKSGPRGEQRGEQRGDQKAHQKTVIFQHGDVDEQEFPETRRVGL